MGGGNEKAPRTSRGSAPTRCRQGTRWWSARPGKEQNRPHVSTVATRVTRSHPVYAAGILLGVDDPVAAARAIVGEVYPSARWAVLGGSVLTAERTAGSDLDIVVVCEPTDGVPHRRSLRWRGWPVELFVHDRDSLAHYLATDLARRQPSLPRMCATGVTVAGSDEEAEKVRHECAADLAAGPAPLPAAELDQLRYALTDALEDLTHSADAREAAVTAAVVWLRTAELALHVAGRWLGAGKWLLRELRGWDPSLADRWLAARDDPTAVAALAREVLDAAGGPLFDGYHATGDRHFRQ